MVGPRGGFFRVEKYEVAPEKLPETLHWFKWEAYLTWLSGFALLFLTYYLGAEAYLVKPGSGLSQVAAIHLGVLFLVMGWLVYHGLCKTGLAESPGRFSIVGLILATLAAFAMTLVFSGRGAYVHFGAMLGTIMAWNVFFVIIPSQKKMVRAMSRGEEPDAKAGRDAARRSLHNNYLTLPVLFIMISNHFPLTYSHPWNWAILAGLSVGSAGVRHWFNLREAGHRNVWILPAASVALIGMAYLTSPSSAPSLPVTDSGEDVAFADVWTVISVRCASCHSETPSDAIFQTAPNGVTFDTPEQIGRHVDEIHNRTVVIRNMPLGNLTGMTDEERSLLARWYSAGAPLE